MLGDVALQRGDVPLAARAYHRRRARPRTMRGLRGVRPKSRSRAASAISCRMPPSCGRSSIPRPNGRSACWPHSPPTRPRASIPSSAADDELRSRIERVLADAALSGPGVGEVFLQLNRLFAQQSDKRAVLVAGPRCRETVSEDARSALSPSRSPRSARATTWQPHPRRATKIDRALELRPDWDRAAILKAEILERKSPGGGDRVAGDVRRRASGVEERDRGARAALRRAEALRRSARADAETVGSRARIARSRIRRRRDRAADEGLRRRPSGCCSTCKSGNYGEPGAIDLYLAQVAEDTKQYAKAIERYQAITEGDRAWLAKLRIARDVRQAGARRRRAALAGGASPPSRRSRRSR